MCVVVAESGRGGRSRRGVCVGGWWRRRVCMCAVVCPKEKGGGIERRAGEAGGA